MAVATQPTKTGISANESYANVASFPAVGKRGVFYIDLATNDAYLWDGAVYELLAGGGGGGTWDSLTGSLTTTASFWSQMPEFPSYLNYFVKEYEHFPNVVAVNFVGDLLGSYSGTNATYQLADKSTALAGINSTEKANGVCFINTGTTSTGRAFLGLGSNNVASFAFGWAQNIWGTRANLPLLSNGTDTFTAYHGYMDIVTAAPGHGAFFRYNHAVNSGKWEYCIAAGSITAADTGVSPTAGVYQVFEINVNTAGTEVTYYIDGALVGTVTTGIPTNGVFPGTNIINSAGTVNSRGAYIDSLYSATERLSAR